MSLNPVYFGTASQQLFGMYDPSVTGGEFGAVLCAPWGQEYLRAHQSLRHLARLLARAGVHAFRFDYAATGDSGGTPLDSSVHQWVEDARAAMGELRDAAGIRKVSVIGLRLGAAVAALAAAGTADVPHVVLWDPVFDGRAYVDELAPPNARRQFPVEVSGFPVTALEYAEVRTVSLHDFDGPLPSTLVVSTQSPHACTPLVNHLRAQRTDVTSQFHAGPQAWVEIGNFGAAGMPVAAIHAIVEWLTP